MGTYLHVIFIKGYIYVTYRRIRGATISVTKTKYGKLIVAC